MKIRMLIAAAVGTLGIALALFAANVGALAAGKLKVGFIYLVDQI